MKKIIKHWLCEKSTIIKAILFLFIVVSQLNVEAQSSASMRRPISPEQPMWLIHIDTWNYADPQKIIDLIPEDIRPYVVMNIALSISNDETTSRFKVAEYGYEIAKSWVRTCAANQMWAIVQLSSGGYAQFSDFDLSVYEEFYRDYPNLIGFNYSEQFWGFGDSNPLSPDWTDRMSHFANLLKLSNKYGGYLVVSWCGNEWSPNINPIAMMKRNPDFAEACQKYTENYILCEKYTQRSYQSDMESICLGAYLSGYSGNYGIRYDYTGWTDANGENENFTMATAGAVHLEHVMLSGETVIDGPELIWTECFHETSRVSTTDGYTKRNWETFSQFDNVSVDIFRKIVDGTVRIPSRQEVIDRTKLVIINDVNSGNSNDIYSSPETMFEGLYRMDGDGNYADNKTFFKKTGRYPTVPTVYQLDDAIANSFQYKVNSSDYSDRWPSVSDKVNEFNNLFPEEYTGDLYAGRHENGWVVYNPYKTGEIASASIPFKYNTCDSMALSFSQYTAGVVKEYANKLTFYLNNYDNKIDTGLKTDTIKIYGSSSEPDYSYEDRASHTSSSVTKKWLNGVFTLIVKHNGALDITVNCSGSASNRLTSYATVALVAPDKPTVYTGPRQYEAECFDYKNISSITTGGYNGYIRNYSGQGYLSFGTSSSASIRDTVYVLRSGNYQLNTKYTVTGGTVTSIDLYVNNTKVATPDFLKTESTSSWAVNTQNVELNAGENIIIFKANRTSSYSIYFDNIIVTQGAANDVYNFSSDKAKTEASTPVAELITVESGTAGVVSFTDVNDKTSNSIKAYSIGATNGTGVADLDMFPSLAANYSVVWQENYGTTGGKKGILLRGSGENGSCSYAEGMKQGYLFIALNNNDNTITLKPYLAEENGLTGKTTYTTSFTVQPGEPCWFRATAYDDQLKFECSSDSVNWEGGSTTLYTDTTYSSGSTELVWGLNSNNFSWVMDNITFLSGNISVSRLALNNFDYTQNGPSSSQSFIVSGSSLTSSILIQAPADFEISFDSTSDYTSALILSPINGNVALTTVYVRLKSGLGINIYSGEITINSDCVSGSSISISGKVDPLSVVRVYEFSIDEATTSAQTPPALNTTIGENNSATAGVVSYTDATGITSNVLTPYTCGQRNSTGVIDLDLFSKKSTDYSVTWKQTVGSDSNYKVGVLLRGDTSDIGDSSTGYVQGIMPGYLFLVYSVGPEDRSEFRIYNSTSSSGLNLMTNGSVSLKPTVDQPIWYRATISGSSIVSLTFEYSTDNINWKIGSSTSDASSSAFTSGATQIVWGLGETNVDFYMDNITFSGLETETGTPVIYVSESSLNGFSYIKNSGPSYSQSFTVSGSALTDNIVIKAPSDYEVSLNSTEEFTSTVTLTQNNSIIEETIIYVRMRSDLPGGTYDGGISLSSVDVMSKTVLLSGTVLLDTQVGVLPRSSATVISTEYYTLMGRRVSYLNNRHGIFIVKELLSDGTVSTYKIWKKRD